jgi:hypothetical protein
MNACATKLDHEPRQNEDENPLDTLENSLTDEELESAVGGMTVDPPFFHGPRGGW